MNQYERDTHVPDYQTMKRIADVLETPVPFFYTEDDTLAEILLHIGNMEPSDLIALQAGVKQKVAKPAQEP